jgi:putative hydrolase of the HAD superfamily
MKYLIWDFDNTLAYREGMWGSTIFELLIEHGYSSIKLDDISPYLKSGFPWHTPEVSHQVFFSNKKWWEYMTEHFISILNELKVEDDVAIIIANKIREKYLNPCKWHLYDDTIYCLKISIEKGYSNIILSNHVPELDELVDNLGIRDYFIKVYSSAQIGYEKPNKKIFEKVLIDINNADNITMVGDSYIADIKGAKEVGIDAILVRKRNDYNYYNYFTSLRELSDFL